MTKEERIGKCAEWFKTLTIGAIITDIKFGRKNIISGLTSSSVELYHTKVSEKGIDCRQWYDIQRLAFLTDDFI